MPLVPLIGRSLPQNNKLLNFIRSQPYYAVINRHNDQLQLKCKKQYTGKQSRPVNQPGAQALSEARFKIVFTGQLQPEWSAELATSALSALLKVDEKTARRFISGTPIALKQELPRDRAEKTREKLQQTGAVVELVAVAPPETPPESSEPEAEPAPDSIEETEADSKNTDTAQAARDQVDSGDLDDMSASEAIRVLLAKSGHDNLIAAAQPGGSRHDSEDYQYIDIQTPESIPRALETSEQDFADFIGINSKRYFKPFHTLYRTKKGGWHWPAFFLPPAWFFYRKLYGHGILATVLMPFTPLSNVIWALNANNLYYQHAREQILELRAHLPDEDISETLHEIGGTNLLAAIGISGLIGAAYAYLIAYFL